MAAPYNPPVKNEDFIFYVAVENYLFPGDFLAAPTIAAGDFKVSKDGGTFANLTTLPTVTPAAGEMIKISLSATEMNADNVVIKCSDQTTPKEWVDLIISIPTTE